MKKSFYLQRPVPDQYPVVLGFQNYPAWLQALLQRDKHYGIDFATPEGTRGYFALAGEVILVKVHPLYGNLVVVQTHHAEYDTFTYYAHLLDPAVVVGQNVTVDDTFGRTGRTGIVTGAHLHFEMRLGGCTQDYAVDPRPYMKNRVKNV